MTEPINIDPQMRIFAFVLWGYICYWLVEFILLDIFKVYDED